MKKHLEQLPHQEDAIKAIMDAMQGCRDIDNNTDVYANPNISVKSGIDVKMETGTGKTYVYTRMMFEMFQKYGINKFIIFAFIFFNLLYFSNFLIICSCGSNNSGIVFLRYLSNIFAANASAAYSAGFLL